ncbi:hypothetical protein BH11ACT6_BH11ACT6_57000 [soil metagenome]
MPTQPREPLRRPPSPVPGRDADNPATVPVGFTLDEAIPEQRFALKGRHWFAAYRLIFVLTDVSQDPAHSRTRVVAETWAAFPGIKGNLYRALVIGSRAHRIIVRRMLKRIAAKAYPHQAATAFRQPEVHPVESS